MLHSKRRYSKSSIDIDRQNQRLRHQIWTGRAQKRLRTTQGSQQRSQQCPHNNRWYVAGASQAYCKKNIRRWSVRRRQTTKHLDPSLMGNKKRKKKWLFSGLGGQRTTPRATSRPLRMDHGPTWYLRGCRPHSRLSSTFEAVVYIRGYRPRSPALPDTKRVDRGLVLYIEIEGLSSCMRWLLIISVLTIDDMNEQIAPREKRTHTHAPLFPPRWYEDLFTWMFYINR